MKAIPPLLLFALIYFFMACESSTGKPFTEKSLSLQVLPKRGADGSLEIDTSKLKLQVRKLKQFAKANNYSTKYALVVDLGMHSGARRFFIIDLPDEKIIRSGLVTHGSSPSYLKAGERQYSNVSGSLCSSLGTYMIGTSYQGSFGLAYKLHGLDTSNSNAFARAIVLHSHSCVPDEETDDLICQSWGCPTVSPAFLIYLANVIDHSSRPVLLNIFDHSK